MGRQLVNGEKIVAERKLRRWTQQTLAELIEVDASVISRLERNLQEDHKISVIIKLADVFDTTIDNLLIDGARQLKNDKFIPELTGALEILSQQSEHSQKQIASIIRAYIATINE